MITGLSDVCLRWEIGLCVITHRLRNSNWNQPGLDHILLCHWRDGLSEFTYIRDSPIIMAHCQDLKTIPRLRGLVLWIDAALI